MGLTIMRHLINRVTFGMPKWQKIGCGAALVVIPVTAGIFFLIMLTLYTGPTEGDARAEVLNRISQAAVRTPRWSSDGQSIVVNIDTAIYGVGISGDRIWRIPNRSKGYRYSPTLATNVRIAYLRFLPRRWPWLPRQFQIAVASIDGSGAKTLADTKILTGPTPTIPTLSPDGSIIAYVAEQNDAHVIRLISPEGIALSDLWLGTDRLAYQGITWSNNSKLLLAIYDNPIFRIESINVSSGQKNTIVESDAGQLFSPAWSSDDRTVYFSQRNNETNTFSLLSAATDGTNKQSIFELNSGQMILDIQISPDSNTVMFISYYLGDPYQVEDPVALEKRIYLIDKNGDNPRVIIYDDVRNDAEKARFTRFWTSWSPTGERIAAYNDDPDAAIVLYTMSPDGSDAKILIRRNANGDLIPGSAEPIAPLRPLKSVSKKRVFAPSGAASAGSAQSAPKLRCSPAVPPGQIFQGKVAQTPLPP